MQVGPGVFNAYHTAKIVRSYTSKLPVHIESIKRWAQGPLASETRACFPYTRSQLRRPNTLDHRCLTWLWQTQSYWRSILIRSLTFQANCMTLTFLEIMTTIPRFTWIFFQNWGVFFRGFSFVDEVDQIRCLYLCGSPMYSFYWDFDRVWYIVVFFSHVRKLACHRVSPTSLETRGDL